MRTHDAVVIGAGHNGLVAANMLADAGWDVVVLEATDRPGGAVQTAAWIDGYARDLCSAFYPLGAASPALTDLDLGSYGLRWAHAPAVLAHVLPDDRCAVLAPDPVDTAASVAEFHPDDGDAWLAEVAWFTSIREGLLETFLRPFPPVRGAARLLRAMTAADLARFARLVTLPVRRYGAERFRGDGARMLVAGCALHTDLGPEQAGSAVFGWLLAMLAQTVGFPAPEGGAGQITAALLRRLEQRGGTVECGQPVERVLHARGTAVGVATAGGELVRAKRAVLADVSAPVLYRDLVGWDALPGRFVDDMRHFQWDNATVKVDWALSAPIPWTAEGARRAGTVHLGGDMKSLNEYASDLAGHRVPHAPFVLLGQMAAVDPSRAPAGAESVWAYTHVPQTAVADTDRLRDQIERMEQLIERHAPGFTASIVERASNLPADLQAHNPSLLGGAVSGGTSAIHQQLFFRPTVGLGRADTPLDRLFLASASAHPGGGVHGASGANAARAALARGGPGGRAYRWMIQGAHRRLYAPDSYAPDSYAPDQG